MDWLNLIFSIWQLIKSTWQQQSHGQSQMSTMNFLWLTRHQRLLSNRTKTTLVELEMSYCDPNEILSVYLNELYHLDFTLKILLLTIILTELLSIKECFRKADSGEVMISVYSTKKTKHTAKR